MQLLRGDVSIEQGGGQESAFTVKYSCQQLEHVRQACLLGLSAWPVLGESRLVSVCRKHVY